MWLPLTSRTAPGVRTRSSRSRTLRTHGPAALTTRAPALRTSRWRRCSVQAPQVAVAPPGDAARARQDARTLLGGTARVQHHQPGVVNPAVAICEAVREVGLQARAVPVAARAGRCASARATFCRPGGRRGRGRRGSSSAAADAARAAARTRAARRGAARSRSSTSRSASASATSRNSNCSR